MVPDVFAVVDGTPYGEYQLMQYGIQQNRTAQLRAAIQVSSRSSRLAASCEKRLGSCADHEHFPQAAQMTVMVYANRAVYLAAITSALCPLRYIGLLAFVTTLKRDRPTGKPGLQKRTSS